METRRYPVIKKVNLDGVSEGYDSECYAYVVPADYQLIQQTQTADVADMSPSEQTDLQLSVVKQQFVSGKIKVFNGTDFILEDMTADDAVASVAIADRIYADIIGFDLDPKDLREVVAANTSQTSNEDSTETTSSEDSGKTSDRTS